MMFRVFGAAAAAALALSAAPAAAQRFSDSYEFLEAIRDLDGAKVNQFLQDKTLRIVNSKDRSNGEGALHIIARKKNVTYLIVLLAQPDINVNLQDNDGDTPLLAAIESGWEDGVARLIKKRANVNLANSAGETPLIRAVLLHNEEIVRQLLEAGANPDRADYRGGLSARDYARRETRWPAIAELLEKAPKGGKNAGAAAAGPRL